jgi:hypothetical protein
MLTNDALRKLLVAIFVGLSFGAAHPVAPQDEDTSKAIKAEVFIKDRKSTARKTNVRYRPAVKTSIDAAATVPPPGMTFAQVGVTFWRFRRSTAADKTKELVEDEDGAVEWTLERIEEGTPLATGQRVRLSIESLSRAGYLYVIDREQYADPDFPDAKNSRCELREAWTPDLHSLRLGKIPDQAQRRTEAARR